jgi:flagellar basal body rod protein FlgC
MDPIATARYGLTAATQRFEASATRIATMGVEGQDVDLAHEMVEMISARRQFSANLSVVRFAQDMWEALLDLQAR